MSQCANIPVDLWRDIRELFTAIVSPCKECVRGTPVLCWHSNCAAFPFRNLARRIEQVPLQHTVRVPQHVLVENEIIDLLSRHGVAVYPSQLHLTSTNSKVNKSHAISRLVRQGRIVEKRINSYTRKISLPANGNPKRKQHQ